MGRKKCRGKKGEQQRRERAEAYAEQASAKLHPAPPPNAQTFKEYPHDASDPELLVVGRKHVLCSDEIRKVAALDGEIGAMAVHDRAKTLVFRHVVTRIEIPLRAQHPSLYNTVMLMIKHAAEQYWNEVGMFGAMDCFMPEIEYIVYDASLAEEPPVINPHRDNGSAITLIVMLSNPSHFVGGHNFFEPKRELRLKCGEAVIFRGELCKHWISPVTKGRRVILQVELQKGKNTTACTIVPIASHEC
jgi:hypothetical protein